MASTPGLPDLDDLRLVVTIAETGAIGSAAAQLHVSQPSASQRLAILERRLGVTLFDRDTRGARLTAAGEELASAGTRALALVAEGVGRAQRPAGGALSVGTIG